MHIEDGSTFVDSPTQGKYLQMNTVQLKDGRIIMKLRLASNGVCWISAPRASGVEGCGRYHDSVTPDARFGCRKTRVDHLAVEGGEVRTSV
jgi:hypothetical protein